MDVVKQQIVEREGGKEREIWRNGLGIGAYKGNTEEEE